MQNNKFDGLIYFIGHIWLIFSPIYFVETCDLAMFFTVDETHFYNNATYLLIYESLNFFQLN